MVALCLLNPDCKGRGGLYFPKSTDLAFTNLSRPLNTELPGSLLLSISSSTAALIAYILHSVLERVARFTVVFS